MGKLGAHPSCVRHPRLGTPISRPRSRTTTTTITSTTSTTRTNTTTNSNPNSKSGCWSRSRSRTSRWSKSASRTRGGGARKSTCSREKRKRWNGGSSTRDYRRGSNQCKPNRCKPKRCKPNHVGQCVFHVLHVPSLRFRSCFQRHRPRLQRHWRPVLVLPVTPLGAVTLSCTLLASPLQGLAPTGTGASRWWSRGGRRSP